MFITTLIIQASNNSISPIISLYIQQLLGGHGNVTLISGVIASIPGIATLIAAPRFGRLGDRIGSERILTIGLILAISFTYQWPLFKMSAACHASFLSWDFRCLFTTSCSNVDHSLFPK